VKRERRRVRDYVSIALLAVSAGGCAIVVDVALQMKEAGYGLEELAVVLKSRTYFGGSR